MRRVLDDAWIEAHAVTDIPEGRARADYPDDTTPMLILRAARSGGLVWTVKYRVGRTQRRLKIGAYSRRLNTAKAREKAYAVVAAIKEGGDPQLEKQAKRKELTLGQLYPRYREEHSIHKKAKSTIKDDDHYFKTYIPAGLKRKPLSVITRMDVKRLHRSRRNHAAASNRMLALLSNMFNWAKNEELFKGDNPCVGVGHHEEKPRERFLLPEELPRFNQALMGEEPYWQAYFALAVLTGFRGRSELLSAKWEYIDWDWKLIRLPDTKNGESHTLPLTEVAIEILKGMPSLAPKGWLFPSSRSKTGHLVEPKKAWRRICVRAGITGLRGHDLRRTLGSWMAAAGHSLPLIGRALNHKSQLSTAIYARLQLDPVRAAMEQATAAMPFRAPALAALPAPEPRSDSDSMALSDPATSPRSAVKA